MECYPLPEKETTFTFANFSWTGLLWIAAIIFVTVAFVVCFIKCRSSLYLLLTYLYSYKIPVFFRSFAIASDC